MNFVVVDNNKGDLDLLVALIAAAVPNSRVEPFTDPLLSAKYVCNNPVDIVFLTDTMRPVNGFRLMQVLRKNIPQLAVVMLSDDEENRMDAVHAGVNEYLLKPVSADRLACVTKQFAAC
ncbi:MAG: response regulator [Oscillospiraceae bacterium]